jgi:hypothetical protein
MVSASVASMWSAVESTAIRFWSWRSTYCPAGSAITTLGMICTNPTIPSARAEPVRSYSSHPMSTLNTAWAREVRKLAVISSRKSGSRIAP